MEPGRTKTDGASINVRSPDGFWKRCAPRRVRNVLTGAEMLGWSVIEDDGRGERERERARHAASRVHVLICHMTCVSQWPRRSWPTRRSSSCPSGHASRSPTRPVTRPSAPLKWRPSTSARSKRAHTHTHTYALHVRLGPDLHQVPPLKLFDPHPSAPPSFFPLKCALG